MFRHTGLAGACALAMTLASPVHAATDAELDEIRAQIRQLKESYEARIQALEQRVKEAEAGVAKAPTAAAAPPAAGVAGAADLLGEALGVDEHPEEHPALLSQALGEHGITRLGVLQVGGIEARGNRRPQGIGSHRGRLPNRNLARNRTCLAAGCALRLTNSLGRSRV